MQQKRIRTKSDGVLANLRYRRRWKHITSVLSVFVAIGTISSLMLPAITLNQYDCGFGEHQHTLECYETNTERILTCCEESLGIHKHVPACYEADGYLVCGYVDFVVHVHDSACFLADGTLTCTLKEVTEYQHTDSCYQSTEVILDEGHKHGDDCYEWVRSEVHTCGITESAGHQHEDACYATGTELICTETEGSGHEHDTSCFGEDGIVICGQEVVASHTHDGTCFVEPGVLLCSIPEGDGHQHTEECFGLVPGNLLCTEEEQDPIVEKSEPVLVCEQTQVILHTHKGTCFEYDTQGNPAFVICGNPEILSHQHTDACFTEREIKTLVCGIPEHCHTDECRNETLLTDEEQAQVDALILLIDTLPTLEEVNAQLASFDASDDMDGREAYKNSLMEQVIPAFEQYDALTEAQKGAVTNAANLMALKWLLPEETPELPPEEQARLEEFHVRLEELPEAQLLNEQLTAFDQARDLTGWEAAVQEAASKAQILRNLYNDLSQELQQTVVGLEKLTALEALLAGAKAPVPTEEEQLQVDELIALIDALPDLAELLAQPAAIAEDGELDTSSQELAEQVLNARSAYDGLNSVQQAAVTNEEKLITLENFLASIGPSVAELQEALALHKAIAELPSIEEIQARRDALAEEEAALEEYETALTDSVLALLLRYEALSDEAKSYVGNSQILLDLVAWLRESGLMEMSPDFETTAETISAKIWVNGIALPDGTSFVLTPVSSDVDVYADAKEQITAYLEEELSSLTDFTLLDMHFSDVHGEELEVDGTTKIALTFEQPIFPDSEHIYVLHFAEEGIEQIPCDCVCSENGITGITLTATNFSLYALAAVTESTIGDTLDGDYAYLQVDFVKNNTMQSGYDIYTGLGNFDNTDAEGNDSTANNNILRTFDVTTYNYTISSFVRNGSPYTYYRDGEVFFEFILPGDSTQVQFETDVMSWLGPSSINATYTITQENYDGSPSQIMRGHFSWKPTGEQQKTIGNASQQLNLAFRALALSNGDKIAPRITFFLDHNSVGKDYKDPATSQILWGTTFYSGGIVTGTDAACSNHGVELAEIRSPEITISAFPSYNVHLEYGSQFLTANYDFNTGNTGVIVDPNAPPSERKTNAINTGKGIVNGMLGVYGAVVQVVGKGNGLGLLGVELPKDGEDITFQLKLSAKYNYSDSSGKLRSEDVTTDYTPLIWSIEGNEATGSQDDGRLIPDAMLSPNSFRVPYNSGGGYNSVYNGGTWIAEQDSENTVTVTIRGIDLHWNARAMPYTFVSGAKTAKDYYTPRFDSNGNVDMEYWDVDIACISAGEIWVLQPYYSQTTGEKITEEKGIGTFTTTLSNNSLVMTDLGGDQISGSETNSNQAVTTDDSVDHTKDLSKSGKMVQQTLFHKVPFGAWNEALTPGGFDTGRDWAIAGGEMGIFTSVHTESMEEGYTVVAIDQLLKFDDALFDLSRVERKTTLNNNVLPAIFYGAKNGGWDHKGLTPDQPGYDADLINSTPDDLIFFSSLSELKAAGYSCCAVLVEYRGLTSTVINNTDMFLVGTAKKTEDAAGYVYMTTHSSRAWNINNLYTACKSEYTMNELLVMGSEEMAEVVDKYIPSRSDTDDPKYKDGDYPEAFWINGEEGGNTTTNGNIMGFTKSYYDDTGYHGPSDGTYFGDSCLLIEHATGILINVAQTTSDGALKFAYDMDHRQRVVDYVVTPSIKLEGGVSGGSEQSMFTTVTMSIDLPATLSYIPGSCYIGGTYQSNGGGVQGSVIGGTELAEEGIVSYTDVNGNTVTAKLTVKETADGTASMTIVLGGVEVGDDTAEILDLIRFSCTIGTEGVERTDVNNGDTIVVSANIRSTEDCDREISISNGNLSNCAVSIVKQASSGLSKFVDTPVVEVGQFMEFTILVDNSSNNPRDLVLADVLPYAEDGVSHFSGICQLEKLQILNPEAIENPKVYYSQEEAPRAADYDFSAVDYTQSKNDGTTVWRNHALHPDYSVMIYGANYAPTAVVVTGTLQPNSTLRIKVVLFLEEGKPGDYAVNRSVEGAFTSTATSRIISRTLEGLAWIDADHDGIQDSREMGQSGVDVTLMKKSDDGTWQDIVTIPSGSQTAFQLSPESKGYNDNSGNAYTEVTGINVEQGTVYAYEMGRYKFENLLPGTYAVRFTSGVDATVVSQEGGTDKTTIHPFDISYYHASPMNVGTDDTLDSDAAPMRNTDDVLKETRITPIIMPAAEDLTTSRYEVKYMDSGFYLWGPELPATGGIGTSAYMFSGWAIILTACALMYNSKRKQRKGAR